MLILMTGIGGFVGQNLAKALKQAGHQVLGLGREKNASTSYTWKDLEAGTLPQVDAVIHLAGKAHDLKNKAGAQVYFDVNTGLTQKIFDWFLASNQARQFYFFSSVKAVADFVPGEILTEDCVPAPVGPYGESKIAAENYLREHFDFSASTKKRVYILRPCMIHGPGNKGNLNLLYAVVRRGFPWPLGAFANRRSFLSIGNLEYIVQEMLGKEIASGAYNLADDEALSTNELVSVICEALGKPHRVLNISPSLIRIFAAAGTFLHLPFNRDRLNKLTENYVVSNAKIKSALNLARLPNSVREGLKITIRAFAGTQKGGR